MRIYIIAENSFNSTNERRIFRLGKNSVLSNAAPAAGHTGRLHAQNNQPLVTVEALLAQKPTFQQRRAQTQFVRRARVPRLAVSVHGPFAQHLRPVPNRLQGPSK